MYVVTGGAGFIGSAFIAKLNAEGIEDILVVDELSHSEKWKNLRGKTFRDYLHKDQFRKQILSGGLTDDIAAIIHMGACSSTTETDVDYLLDNNFGYSRDLARFACSRKIRFIYASSAATYGDGQQGYSDKSELKKLAPLNPYGYSKQLFDLHMERSLLGNKAVGLKFFNVFGPNEYHKAEMKSVVYKAWQQIKASGQVQLFKSYNPQYRDGEQRRDFVYVKDCCEVMWWLLKTPQITGVFNLGTGQARSWNDLVNAVFTALGRQPCIEYIDMPGNLRGQYQYFTQAEMAKLKEAGCPVEFRRLEDAVKDYVLNYLEAQNQYL